MITTADIRARRDEIIAIGKRYGAFNFRIFGSVARGDATDQSDLDLIVKFEPDRSLLDHGGLLMDLRELLQMKVDVIDEDGMRPRFRDNVLKEALPL